MIDVEGKIRTTLHKHGQELADDLAVAINKFITTCNTVIADADTAMGHDGVLHSDAVVIELVSALTFSAIWASNSTQMEFHKYMYGCQMSLMNAMNEVCGDDKDEDDPTRYTAMRLAVNYMTKALDEFNAKLDTALELTNKDMLADAESTNPNRMSPWNEGSKDNEGTD